MTLTDDDKRLIECITDAFPTDDWVYHLLHTFMERITPEHYIYAGWLLRYREQDKNPPYKIINHLN